MSAVVARTLACLINVRRLVISYQGIKVTKLTTLSRAIKPLEENRYKGIRGFLFCLQQILQLWMRLRSLKFSDLEFGKLVDSERIFANDLLHFFF
jgi:hypothetical protein